MLLIVVCVLAAIPALLFIRNLWVYSPPKGTDARRALSAVSVLIPARNEERNIATAIESVLANGGIDFELIVGDDHSDDRTAAIVKRYAAMDSRVRLLPIPPLPAGWNGKQHACYHLALASQYPLLCFVDADVRLTSDALARMAGLCQASDAALQSSVPRQVTETWLERLLIPLIHFVLLGYLPMDFMRRGTDPAFAAGCGQLILVHREPYFRIGGHSAIAPFMHDGLKLTAAFRQAGYRTDLFDATSLATCRMYQNGRETWDGLAKNATEGMATAGKLPVFTVLLFGGQVLPLALLAWALVERNRSAILLAAAATILAYLPRVLAIRRFRQSVLGACLHPAGVLILLSIQWYALLRSWLGYAPSWKGRAYATSAVPVPLEDSARP